MMIIVLYVLEVKTYRMFRDDLDCQGASIILSKLYGIFSPISVLPDPKTAYVSIYLVIGF